MFKISVHNIISYDFLLSPIIHSVKIKALGLLKPCIQQIIPQAREGL